MKNKTVQKIYDKYYTTEEHPFQIFNKYILDNVQPEYTVLDAGCGRNALLLSNLIGKVQNLIGIDLVDFEPDINISTLKLINNNLNNINLNNETVDLVISRSVLEHIENVEEVYFEINRVLKKNGKFIFLVPNLYDYVSIISFLTPNSLHKKIVSIFSGRPTQDTFPTYYKSNTTKSINLIASKTGFSVKYINYYGQYPYMLEINPLLFLIGTAYDKLISRYTKLKYLRGWILAELIKK